MMRILVTGAGGLVGATCVEVFSQAGWQVVGVENGMRAKLLGREGDTLSNLKKLAARFPRAEFHELDVRSSEAAQLTLNVEAVIHCAAQPSHPKSIEIPLEDADINIRGTLNLLETLRVNGRKHVPFVFCSTNKVYGDAPNELPYLERPTRFELANLPAGIDETLPIDRCMHTPFGVSKAAADLYTQEYGLLYGLPTGAFRMSCITGPWSRATVFQNWIAYFMRCARERRPLTVYGYGGKQVRDNIDARDLVRGFQRFIESPRPGEVYNMGGGPANSVSCLETIARIEQMQGEPMSWSPGPEREADHRVFITDTRKFREHFPDWKIEVDLDQIFQDLWAWVDETITPCVA